VVLTAATLYAHLDPFAGFGWESRLRSPVLGLCRPAGRADKRLAGMNIGTVNGAL
jgi:hypothetical protein